MNHRGHRTVKTTQSSLRIIGGQWRSRRLSFPAVDGLRPTGDRQRETLFNWLSPYIYGARCLDAFAGSGALGLEALSRGARHCTFIEYTKPAEQSLRENLKLLNAQNAIVHRHDAIQWLSGCRDQYDLVFLDPPFRRNFVQPCLDLIHNNQLLADNALVYIEVESEISGLIWPEQWKKIKEKTSGQVRSILLHYATEPMDEDDI